MASCKGESLYTLCLYTFTSEQVQSTSGQEANSHQCMDATGLVRKQSFSKKKKKHIERPCQKLSRHSMRERWDSSSLDACTINVCHRLSQKHTYRYTLGFFLPLRTATSLSINIKNNLVKMALRKKKKKMQFLSICQSDNKGMKTGNFRESYENPGDCINSAGPIII